MGGGSSDNRRRPKAALFLLACGVAGVLPHGLGPVGRLLPALGLAGLLGVYAVRTVFLRPQGAPAFTTAALEGSPPAVDVVVAARDEEAVIGRLVERVLRLRWPTEQLRLWVIDDGSEDRTPQRLADLQDRLDVLCKEREELLLRIETVATLRQEAFMEAFTAVDGHFREIFAGLSDGEGFLQLENPQDPLEGGLSLVAHPKGKAVRRLASMSGGEKSLTALSFLFALQRFRPSPFYALDEVDSFLDGVNVERLAGLIARQADQAQFMVVSHRRPMIAASTRTIGVTQARGAHTQVVGLPPAA